MIETKYLVLISIAVGFSILIYFISKLFATTCPTGLELVNGACVETCLDSEVRDPKNYKCRPNCGLSQQQWSDINQVCEDCEPGKRWFDNINLQERGSCLPYCDNDSDCPSGGKCFKNKCYSDICQNADGSSEGCDAECLSANPDKKSKSTICCVPDKVYFKDGNNECCPGDSVYNPTTNTCTIKCGNNFCNMGEECLTINNVSEKARAELTGQPDVTINGNRVDMCYKNDKTCSPSLQYTIPNNVGSYHPCVQLYDKGYCTSVSGDATTTKKCYSSYKDKDKCDNNSSGICRWNNILETVGSSGTPEATVNSINNELTNLNYSLGDYCGADQNVPYMRVVTTQLEQPTCGYKDCLTYFSQKNIDDIYYNDASKLCVALQNCAGENTSSAYINYLDPNNKEAIKTFPNSDSTLTDRFLSCSSDNSSVCNIIQTAGSSCNKKDGTIRNSELNRKVCNQHGSLNQTGSCDCDTVNLFKIDFFVPGPDPIKFSTITKPLFTGISCDTVVPVSTLIEDDVYIDQDLNSPIEINYRLRSNSTTGAWSYFIICPVSRIINSNEPELEITFPTSPSDPTPKLPSGVTVTPIGKGCLRLQNPAGGLNPGGFDGYIGDASDSFTICVKNRTTQEVYYFTKVYRSTGTFYVYDLAQTPGPGANYKIFEGAWGTNQATILYVGYKLPV